MGAGGSSGELLENMVVDEGVGGMWKLPAFTYTSYESPPCCNTRSSNLYFVKAEDGGYVTWGVCRIKVTGINPNFTTVKARMMEEGESMVVETDKDRFIVQKKKKEGRSGGVYIEYRYLGAALAESPPLYDHQPAPVPGKQ